LRSPALISACPKAECHAVLAFLSERYPPLEGRSPTRYSPVCHSTQGRSPFRVRLACIRHAASVDSEPGSNSHVKAIARLPLAEEPSERPTQDQGDPARIALIGSCAVQKRLTWMVQNLVCTRSRHPLILRRASCLHVLSSFQRTVFVLRSPAARPSLGEPSNSIEPFDSCQPFLHLLSKFFLRCSARGLSGVSSHPVCSTGPIQQRIQGLKNAPMWLEHSGVIRALTRLTGAAPRGELSKYTGPSRACQHLHTRKTALVAFFFYLAAITDAASIVLCPSASPTSPFTSTVFDANATSFAFFSSANLPVNV
jgi:hypothetical protein